jgi:hypothetical protein
MTMTVHYPGKVVGAPQCVGFTDGMIRTKGYHDVDFDVDGSDTRTTTAN